MNKNIFTRSDLKTGMVIKLRNKDELMVLKSTIGSIRANGGKCIAYNKELGVIPLVAWDNQLTFMAGVDDTDTSLDIIEVRKMNTVEDIFEDYTYNELELVWRRGEPIRYVSGFLFGNNSNFIWKSKDVECSVDDIIEVETCDGLQIAKVKEVMFISSYEYDKDFGIKNNVVRNIEY